MHQADQVVWVITEGSRSHTTLFYPMNTDFEKILKKGEKENEYGSRSRTEQHGSSLGFFRAGDSLRNIQESKTNPRRQFDEAKLAELAGNIRQHGVLQPVLVRPLPDEPGQFELVAGGAGYRASKLAGRETISASVRALTDTHASNCN